MRTEETNQGLPLVVVLGLLALLALLTYTFLPGDKFDLPDFQDILARKKSYNAVPSNGPTETVEMPVFNMSIAADGAIVMRAPTDIGMPQPDCKELGCDRAWWEVFWQDHPDGNQVVDVNLYVDGNLVGKGQYLKIALSEFESLTGVAVPGVDAGWIGHISVAKEYMGMGLGKLVWMAGDEAVKLYASAYGLGTTVRFLNDTVGWGPALMARVPVGDIVYQADNLWAYLIRGG